MPRPDGMATMAQELNEMREAKRDPGFTHEVVAVDSSGNTVFETESLYAHETDDALESYPSGDDAPEGVDHYEIKKR